MSNSISITMRISETLDSQLNTIKKVLGFSKTTLIRLSIHEFLDCDELNDIHDLVDNEIKTKRLVFNTNKYSYSILKRQSEKYNISVNSLLIYSSLKAVKHYSTLIEKLEL